MCDVPTAARGVGDLLARRFVDRAERGLDGV